MKLGNVLKKYHAGFLHSPSHFISNSFEIEQDGPRLVLTGRVKRHERKHFRIVAILRAKTR